VDTIKSKLIIEVIILKRTLIFIIVLLISVFISIQNCKACNVIGELNNKTLSSDTAIKHGNIVMISYLDSVSGKTKNNHEMYNISKLDNFIENIKKGKKIKVRIVKYEKNKTGTWVNKLLDLEYDGHKIIDTEYDVYTNPNDFIPVEKTYSDFMKKREYTDGLWYGLCTRNASGESCYSLISFLKSSIVN
jgi:hypothetical protein